MDYLWSIPFKSFRINVNAVSLSLSVEIKDYHYMLPNSFNLPDKLVLEETIGYKPHNHYQDKV